MTPSRDLSRTRALQQRFESALMPNYGLPPVALARGEGCRVTDVDGHTYLDMYAGIAVSSLGHAHPAIAAAVAEQTSRLVHTSNLLLHEGEVVLAEKLLGLLDAEGRVFFANSGAEANEAALKIVRRANPARQVHVAVAGSFHGRTAGALSLTGKDAIREPFGPFGREVRFVPFGDAEALAAAVDEQCAAVFVEPALGEGGVVPPPEGYLRRVRAICDATGAAFVLDEIQSGIGRTGHWFAHQAEDVLPDVLTLAKGLGGGMPIGACVGLGRYGTALGKGDHGTTFGGNPVCVAAALAVLETIEAEGLLANAAVQGERLAAGLRASDHPWQHSVRGMGLWRAAVLAEPRSAAVQEAAAALGFLVNPVAPDAVRLAPPLTITAEEVAEFTAAWPVILADAQAQHEGA